MPRFAILSVVSVVLVSAPPLAAQHAEAEFVSPDLASFSAGIVCEPLVVGLSPAPDTIAGTTNIVEEMPDFISSGRIVPAVLGIGFGAIAASDAGDLFVTIVVTHPPMGPDGVKRESYESSISAASPSMAMFTFEYDYELVTGPWSFTALRGEEVLYHVAFTVASPARVPELAGRCGYENLLS